MLMSGDGHHL
jgi:hypothetical protein